MRDVEIVEDQHNDWLFLFINGRCVDQGRLADVIDEALDAAGVEVHQVSGLYVADDIRQVTIAGLLGEDVV